MNYRHAAPTSCTRARLCACSTPNPRATRPHCHYCGKPVLPLEPVLDDNYPEHTTDPRDPRACLPGCPACERYSGPMDGPEQ